MFLQIEEGFFSRGCVYFVSNPKPELIEGQKVLVIANPFKGKLSDILDDFLNRLSDGIVLRKVC